MVIFMIFQHLFLYDIYYFMYYISYNKSWVPFKVQDAAWFNVTHADKITTVVYIACIIFKGALINIVVELHYNIILTRNANSNVMLSGGKKHMAHWN